VTASLGLRIYDTKNRLKS